MKYNLKGLFLATLVYSLNAQQLAYLASYVSFLIAISTAYLDCVRRISVRTAKSFMV